MQIKAQEMIAERRVQSPSEVPVPRKVPLGLMSKAVMGAAKLFVLVCRNTSISPTSV